MQNENIIRSNTILVLQILLHMKNINIKRIVYSKKEHENNVQSKLFEFVIIMLAVI